MGKFRQKFLTPNSPLPGGNFVLKLIIPKDVQFVMHFLGALTDLAEEINWEEVGSMTPEEAAEIWSRILSAYEQSEEEETGVTMPIGSIVPYTGAVVPENWLMCDGSNVSQSEYPELTAVVDDALKDTINGVPIIRIPNLRGKFIMGEQPATHDMLETGGEETHTLTIAEMPSHTHGINRSLVAAAGTQRRAVEGASSDVTTLSEGGDEPHNNLPPFIVLRYIMRVK